MAQVMLGNPKKFKDRGYAYQRPTIREAQDMGWRNARVGYVDMGKYDEMVKWCQENIWWQDYITSFGEFYFKNEQDVVLFLLRWR